MRIRSSWFAEGQFNQAYPAYYAKAKLKLVAKRNKREYKDLGKEFYLKQLRKNSLAVSLARGFNKEIGRFGEDYNWAKLEFVRTFLIEDEDSKFYFLEGYIEGEYKKFTNNSRY